MKPLLAPGIALVTVVVLLQTGLFPANPLLISYSFYGAATLGMLLAWRFHSTRIFSALLIVLLAQRAIAYYSPVAAVRGANSNPALAVVGLLLPVNFVAIALQREKGFTFSVLGPSALILFVQSVIVAVVCRPGPPAIALHASHPAAAMPFATIWAFAAAALALLLRFFLLHKPMESGLLWALAACFLALRSGGVGRIPATYFCTAAFLLAASIVETSYLLAYHDELTTLPSRRAFNDALLRLEAPYTIAMLDIDHFKRCNDTYGHDTGDQVLRMVASRLGRVSGGGQAYRCGGEEFAILFPGKTSAEVIEHLEKLRADIEASSLRLRGADRRQEPRGPDRRNPGMKAKTRAGRATREISRANSSGSLSVTASIGVAASGPGQSSPHAVIEAADRALYRAKGEGRNRVEIASAPRRAPAKSAGIA